MPVPLPPTGSEGYPEWFTAGIGPQLQAKGPEAIANLYADYVSSHPEVDFGPYWNAFKPNGANAQQRFGNGAPNTPYGPAPPPPGDTDGSTPSAPDTSRQHVTTSMPTSPGGPEPGRWQRLVSFVNGQRQERWKWIPDPTAQVQHPPPQPQIQPNTTPPPPAADPPPTPTPTPDPHPGGWRSTQQNPGDANTQTANYTAQNPVRNALNPGGRFANLNRMPPGPPPGPYTPNPNTQQRRPWQTRLANQQNPNL